MGHLEHLLDLCLTQLNTGSYDLETVLAQYPQERAALEPMLRAALALRHTPPPQPRPEARAAGQERLLAALIARLPADALDQALAVLRSGAPVDEALAGSPYAAQLKPLVRLAMQIEATPQPQARPEAQAAGLARLIQAVEDRRRFLGSLDWALSHVQAGQSADAVLDAADADADDLAPAVKKSPSVATSSVPAVAPR